MKQAALAIPDNSLWMSESEQLRYQIERVFNHEVVVNPNNEDLLADKITFWHPQTPYSKLLLMELVRNSRADVYVVDIRGEYTSLAPLAVSDEELKRNAQLARLLSREERKLLSEAFDKISTDDAEFVCLDAKDNLLPLSRGELESHILEQLTEPMKMSELIGMCMGHAPLGWPSGDMFYYDLIKALSSKGQVDIENIEDGFNASVMKHNTNNI